MRMIKVKEKEIELIMKAEYFACVFWCLAKTDPPFSSFCHFEVTVDLKGVSYPRDIHVDPISN